MSFTQNDKFKLLSAVGDPEVRDKLVQEIEQAAAGQIVLASGKMLVGNGSGVGAGVTMSGDATLSNAGVLDLAASCVSSAELNPVMLQYNTTTVTSAQILALNTTPITIVPAPGAGKVNIVDSIYVTLTYNSAAYSTNAAGFTVRYTNGGGATVGATLTQGFLQSSASAIQSVRAAATALTPVANAPIVLYADTANPTTGDSDLKVLVYYRVVSNPAF